MWGFVFTKGFVTANENVSDITTIKNDECQQYQRHKVNDGSSREREASHISLINLLQL